ncbi:hypothetical protein ACUOCP_50145, partial [Escherichia sp. R-CC3]
MEFAHRIIRQLYLTESHRFWKMETAPATLVDMAAFGMAAKSFGDQLLTEAVRFEYRMDTRAGNE